MSQSRSRDAAKNVVTGAHRSCVDRIADKLAGDAGAPVTTMLDALSALNQLSCRITACITLSSGKGANNTAYEVKADPPSDGTLAHTADAVEDVVSNTRIDATVGGVGGSAGGVKIQAEGRDGGLLNEDVLKELVLSLTI